MKKRKIKFASSDYLYSSLPVTRKQEFFDLYKNSFNKIFYIGLILLIFALPMLAYIIFMDYGFTSLNAANYPDSLSDMLYVWDLYDRLGISLSYPILLVGISIILSIEKKLIWQEGVSFIYEIKNGFLENYRQLIKPTIFLLIFYYLSFYVSETYTFSFITYLPLLLVLLIFFPLYLWHIQLLNYYEAKFLSSLKNSLFFFAKSMPFTLLMAILNAAPFIFYYLPINASTFYYLIKYIILVALILFYYPLLSLIFSLYAHNKFDEYINVDNFPNDYHRGLYDK